MAEHATGVYGHPYPRVDQFGNPVPPVDQYGNPIPDDPAAPCDTAAGYVAPSDPVVSTVDYDSSGAVSYGLGAGAGHPHESAVSGASIVPGGEAYAHDGGVPPGEKTFAYEGMVSTASGTGAGQLQPTREEGQTTLGETLRRSGKSSSSSSSSSEDDGQGGRRKKKSIKEKIKEKLPGSHKQEEHKAGQAMPAAGTGTHAAGKHEKKGIVEKIKEKLPGHGHGHH